MWYGMFRRVAIIADCFDPSLTELLMTLLVPGIAACLLYAVAAYLQLQRTLGSEIPAARVKTAGFLAVACHAVTNYLDFVGDAGIDLGVYAMLSLMALSIVAIVLLSSLRRPVDNLFVVIFPVAILTLVLELALQGNYSPREDITGGIFSHIALSIAAYSILTIAAAQAVVLTFGDHRLRHHQLTIVRNLPPLETMEQLMFEMLWIGLAFLTLSIFSGFLFLEDLSGPGLVHHTVITMAAWIVFAVLLWGRYQLGWRGAIASRWVLSGFALLVLGYFGSKVVLEIVLGRT